jgi:hypothetical protein
MLFGDLSFVTELPVPVTVIAKKTVQMSGVSVTRDISLTV